MRAPRTLPGQCRIWGHECLRPRRRVHNSRRARFGIPPRPAASAIAAAAPAGFRSHAQAADRDGQDLARGERWLHADGQDRLPQQGGRRGHPGVRLPAAEAARREGAPGAGVGAREHPRTFVRTLHSVRARGDGQGLYRDRARVPGQHRLRQDVLRRDRLRRRRSGRRGDGGRRAENEIPGRGSSAHRHHRLEPRRHDHAAVDLPESRPVQLGGRDGAGDESLSAPRVEGRRAAAPGDRPGKPLRRTARRAARRL